MNGRIARRLRRFALHQTGPKPTAKQWPQYVERDFDNGFGAPAHAGITRRHYRALKRAYARRGSPVPAGPRLSRGQ